MILDFVIFDLSKMIHSFIQNSFINPI